MTYAEMQKAEAGYSAATTTQPKAKKQRGATKAQLAYRADRHARALCVYCGETFASHTLQQTIDCSNARS